MPGDDHAKVVVLVPFPCDTGSMPGLIEGVKELLGQFGKVYAMAHILLGGISPTVLGKMCNHGSQQREKDTRL